MDRFTRADLKSLLDPGTSPGVSVYMATHRGGAEEDLVQWKDDLNDAERRLIDRGMRSSEARDLLAGARDLLTDKRFWNGASDGLAVFIANGSMRSYRLPLAVPNQVVVGPRFHVKPLLPWVDGDGQFYLLAISQNRVRVLRGTAHSMDAVAVPNLPASREAARAEHDRDEVLNYHTARTGAGREMTATFHGQGVGVDDAKAELLRYFQKVDAAVTAALGPDTAPLVLATVEYLAPIYRKANKYSHLLEEFVAGNPDRESDKDLHARVWPLVSPLFRQRADRAVAQYQQLDGTGRTVHDLPVLLPAAHRGELETLFVVGNRNVWGRFEPDTGRVEVHATPRTDSEDLVNLAVTFALGRGRRVHSVQPQAPFNGVPLAGTYFVPMNKHGKRG